MTTHTEALASLAVEVRALREQNTSHRHDRAALAEKLKTIEVTLAAITKKITVNLERTPITQHVFITAIHQMETELTTLIKTLEATEKVENE